MKTTNKVQMQGRIVYAKETKNGNTSILLEMVSKGRTNTIIWTYQGKLPDGISRRDKIVVSGHVVAYSTKNAETGKWKYNQFFVADSIKPAKSTIEKEWGLRGNFYEPDYFVAKFSGQIARIVTTGENWAKVTIRVDDDHLTRAASFVTLSYLKTSRMPSIKNMQVGDSLYVVASISTSKKESEDGERRIYETLIAEDAAKGRIPVSDKK